MKNKTPKKIEYNMMHFRVDTPAMMKEITDCGLVGNAGVLKIPINIFMNLLAQVAQRATELKDPIMNKIMFDLNLYELPSPVSVCGLAKAA